MKATSALPCILGCLLNGLSPSTAAEHANEITVSFGGRIKLDAILNSNSISRSRQSKADLAFTPRVIPLSNTASASDFNYRESRLWSTLILPVAGSAAATYVEFDLFDTALDANGVSHVTDTPRLRHLYTDYGGWTVGKTFTNFVNPSAYPEINDANGPVGNHLIRQMLLRYRQSIGDAEYSLSLEHGESTLIQSGGNRIQVSAEQLPDIIARIGFVNRWGQFSIASMVRQLNSGSITVSNSVEKTWAGAISVGGRFFIHEQDNLRLTLSFGNALGRYVSGGAFDDAAVTSTGKLDLNEIISGHLAYQRWWSHELRSTLALGAAYASINTAIAGSETNRIFASSMLNLIWSPTIKSSIGIEWLYGYRQQYNDEAGQMNRIQISTIYRFN